MGKAEIVHRIAEETNLTHTKAEEVVEAILREIKSALRAVIRSSCAALAHFKCGTRVPASGATPKPAKKRLSYPAASYDVNQVINSEMP
jgi:nucleoid DNA-binding protein